ncbi:hypothetical protein ACFWZ2_03525 [Streptomyces sp. NPDC059002]|uniref:hypothetical protein n=1 Tax=Streptomyces sp. NPDC059002 TaxID=3346690 RepID=UPI0036CC31EE
MKVHLTRDSVAMGDDAYAPHAETMELPDGMPLREAVTAVGKGRYLASIAGGAATWVLTGADGPIAVVAQQWNEPRLLHSGPSAPTSPATDERAVHWHFRYLAQRDPDAVYDELRAASTT